MNSFLKRPTRMALIAAASAVPLSTFAATDIKVHTIGDSLVLGSTDDARSYVRDYYGYGGIAGSSDPGDPAYNPVPFYGWRPSLQFHLADQGFNVDMVGNVSSVSDLPDTLINAPTHPTDPLAPQQFTTADLRTYSYDSDNDAHGGWRIGGTYDLANVNGRTNLQDANGGATTGNGSFVYTPGQIPFSTFDNHITGVDASPADFDTGSDGIDLIDTGGNGLIADGADVFDRGIADHLAEFATPFSEANVIFLQIGINDVKNREDVENPDTVTFTTKYDQVYNGNGQSRLYDLVAGIRAMVDDDVEIYVSNIPTVNEGFDYEDDYANDAPGLAQARLDAQDAIEAFNDRFFDDYFGPWQDLAGYTDAIAEATDELLNNVFLVNTHGQIDNIIGVGTGSEDYLAALSDDGLHWNEATNDQLGEFYGKLIGANTAVPEPGSFALLTAAGMLLIRRRRPA